MAKVRLFVDQPLPHLGTEIAVVGGQAHYLLDVMRLPAGGGVIVFNGLDGEWRAQIAERAKKTCRLRLEARLRPQVAEPGPWLLFALLKRDCTDFVIGKATELGVERLMPVMTRHTVASPANSERLRSIATDAAEQCGRLTVPPVLPATPLATTLGSWPTNRPLLVMTPAGQGIPFRDLRTTSSGKTGEGITLPPGIVIGPEGGLTASELDELRALPFVTAVSLGPLVLRAETAAIAALACWQALAGGWAGTLAEGAN